MAARTMHAGMIRAPLLCSSFPSSLSTTALPNRLCVGFQRGSELSRRCRRPFASSSSSPKRSSSSTSLWSSGLLAWYATKLDTHPLTTKCLTSGLVSAAGDMLCQYLTLPTTTSTTAISGQEPITFSNSWDMARTGRFACLGALWVGPVLHHWYGYLARLSNRVWVRVAIDQFACAPIFVTSFLAWLWLWEGQDDLPARLQSNVPSIVVANWTLWIPAQAVNFTLVPVKYHVLFSNVVALAWNAYLSYSSHNSDQSNKGKSNQEEQEHDDN